MSQANMLRILKTLSELPGVSGLEHAVRNEILSEIKNHCEYYVDPLGNIIAHKKGANSAKNVVHLSAHMDEVGFIVTQILEDGLLKVQPVGGVDTRVAFGRAVEVGTKRLPGTLGGKATHHVKKEEQDTVPAFDDMVIDIGALTKEDAAKHVSLGDRAMFESDFELFGQDKIVGKAFDDRAGCAMMIDMIQSKLAYDCVFTFTVMEENGCIGGQTAAYTVNAEYAICIETTTAADIGGVAVENQVCRQGNGAAISFGDNGTIYNTEFYQTIFDIAKDKNLPCQAKEGIYGGNEGRVMQTARSGAKTIAMSLPCRYLHSATNTLDIKDITSMRALLEAIVAHVAVKD